LVFGYTLRFEEGGVYSENRQTAIGTAVRREISSSQMGESLFVARQICTTTSLGTGCFNPLYGIVIFGVVTHRII